MTAQTASVRNIQLCLYRKVSCGFRLLLNVYWFFSWWSKKESTCILPRSSEVHHNKSVSCKIDLLLKFAVLFDNNRISVTKVWRGHVGSGTRCIKTYNLSTAEYKLYQSTVIKWSGYQCEFSGWAFSVVTIQHSTLERMRPLCLLAVLTGHRWPRLWVISGVAKFEQLLHVDSWKKYGSRVISWLEPGDGRWGGLVLPYPIGYSLCPFWYGFQGNYVMY